MMMLEIEGLDHSDARHLGAFLEALRDNPDFVFGLPQSAPALPDDHLDTTIRVAFMPGIKHGICHRSPPTIKK
jgi:hypothetical protein